MIVCIAFFIIFGGINVAFRFHPDRRLGIYDLID
jgi:hypothetical protein